ncbi:hypothetical protein Moror_14949 [Moniliophthora roreri MCA 2997]|uniref:DUF6593 domain-containing protein n=1 Tax=Moniliophthora roreri (strain MCA 2997) TaxID=1381753 RepID=V2WXB1_MONRO|nr:hypothetical protein Moror_14949 [Moniliophthora roreri MCA 2997]KAI3621576.1 hypothetical protein WG66_000378 [Moniliophthora roreri]
MELSLVNNNPAHTLLITQDGVPAYSIQTSQDGASSHQETILKTTKVTRLERRSSGRTETEVGQILYFGIDRLRLSLQCNGREEFKLEVLNLQGDSSVDLGSNSSWSFTGPDDKPYKWQLFIQYPVLFLDDNSQTPIARYRRAKLGIVSRSRRPFLEIFPAGINCIDLIVATFVSYMIQRFPQITQTH